MKYKLHPVASCFDDLPIGDIAPNLVDAHVRESWIITTGQAADCGTAGNQAFDDCTAEKAAAAGYQNPAGVF
jgi:hypothetical protein